MTSLKLTLLLLLVEIGCLAVDAGDIPSPLPPGGDINTSAQHDTFVHPGGLHSAADLQRMRSKVELKLSPWIEGWNRLLQDPKSAATYRAAANPRMPSRQRAQDDACAAYLNALRWYIAQDTAHADCAVRILNSWSAAIADANPGPDERGLSGIPIGSFALAAEVLRLYPGWLANDQERFKKMLRDKLYPLAHDFLTQHNGRDKTAFWANWDACNMLALVAIGVYCDDRRIFDEGITYYKQGQGMGAIMNAVPVLYADGLGQWQESGRDHAHALGGQGLEAELCQVAWNQGVDLFGYADNRLLAGAEYEAQFTQWMGVPYTFYNNFDHANQFYISKNYRGRLGNCQYYELLYNHYMVRQGIAAPQTKKFAELLRPEGGNADILGYGTLTYTLDAATSPYPPSPIPPVPQELSALAGLGRVMLAWSPSGAYATHGYEIFRTQTAGKDYVKIFTTDNNTTPRYVDTTVEAGKTYYYVVSAKNQAGTSQQSSEVGATPLIGQAVHGAWKTASLGSPREIGSCTSDAEGKTLRLVAQSGNLGGKADSAYFAYQTVSGDFTISARLIELNGQFKRAGLMMRDATSADGRLAALTLGENGGRQTRFWSRMANGEQATVQAGHDYVWPIAWFRLQRRANQCIASQSSDGITWFTCGTSEIPMNKEYQIGLAACGDSADKPLTAIFDHIRLEVTPPNPPPVPTTVVATSGPDSVRLAWQHASAATDGFKIECSRDGRGFYEITDLTATATSFVNTGLIDQAYSYRIRAYNSGGYSDYAPLVKARPTAKK